MVEQSALEVIQGNQLFANDLYRMLSKTEGNVLFSPISVHSVLSMLYQGAGGSTAHAIAILLKAPTPLTVAVGYREILTRLNSPNNITLSMANSIFVSDRFNVLPDYKQTVQDYFASEVQILNVDKNVVAATTINQWVQEQTNQMIRNLIQPDYLDNSTAAVLVNAIYFKGTWKHQFVRLLTQTEKFWVNAKSTVDVQMMHIEKRFRYKEDASLNAKVLEIPYTNDAFSMLIILPNKRHEITELETKLMGTTVRDVTTGLKNADVNLALPKFKITATIDLQDALTKVMYNPWSDDPIKAFIKRITGTNPIVASYSFYNNLLGFFK